MDNELANNFLKEFSKGARLKHQELLLALYYDIKVRLSPSKNLHYYLLQ